MYQDVCKLHGSTRNCDVVQSMRGHSILTQYERNGKKTSKQCHLRIVLFLMQIPVEALSSGRHPVHVLRLIRRNDIK